MQMKASSVVLKKTAVVLAISTGWALVGLRTASADNEADERLRRAYERVIYGREDSGPGRYQGVNPAQRLELEFNGNGARLRHPLGDIEVRLTGYGYGERLRSPVKA